MSLDRLLRTGRHLARWIAGEREIVRLTDGAFVVLRPLHPNDREPLRRGIAALSAKTRHLRFQGAGPTPTEAELDFLLSLDGHDRAAWCAIDPWTRSGLGVARYARVRNDPPAAEVALTIADTWQHRGIGRHLLDRLARTAQDAGIRRFRATVLAENRPVLEWFDSLGAVMSRLPDRQVEAEFDVAARRMDDGS